MKILFFLPNLEGGGAQRVVLNLAEAFAAKEYEVTLVVAIPSGSLLNAVPTTVKLIHLNLKRSYQSILPLAKVIKTEKPDIIYSRMNYGNIITSIACTIARTKAKFVATIANTLTPEQFGSKNEERIMFGLERLTYKRAAIVVANSTDTYNDLVRERIATPSKLTVIFNPVVDYDAIVKKASEPLTHPWLTNKSSPVLVAVGRLSPQKNYPFLLRSFAELKKKTSAKLIILGEGQLKPQLEEQIKALGLNDDVSMPGFANPFPFYKYADAFVLTSLWEGFGNVIVEAMACGCPVVASNCPGGPKEILEHGKYGKLVDGYDEQTFADAIFDMLNNPTDKNMLKAQAGEFAIDKIVKEYEALFKTL